MCKRKIKIRSPLKHNPRSTTVYWNDIVRDVSKFNRSDGDHTRRITFFHENRVLNDSFSRGIFSFASRLLTPTSTSREHSCSRLITLEYDGNSRFRHAHADTRTHALDNSVRDLVRYWKVRHGKKNVFFVPCRSLFRCYDVLRQFRHPLYVINKISGLCVLSLIFSNGKTSQSDSLTSDESRAKHPE